MKKMATKKMTYGGAKTMMSKGGKTTAKPKMEKGGATKKKYMVGGATDEKCWPGKPGCAEGSYSKGRGTGKPKMGIGQKIKNVLSGSTSKKVKVKK
jgi:hypothetical protein